MQLSWNYFLAECSVFSFANITTISPFSIFKRKILYMKRYGVWLFPVMGWDLRVIFKALKSKTVLVMNWKCPRLGVKVNEVITAVWAPHVALWMLLNERSPRRGVWWSSWPSVAALSATGNPDQMPLKLVAATDTSKKFAPSSVWVCACSCFSAMSLYVNMWWTQCGTINLHSSDGVLHTALMSHQWNLCKKKDEWLATIVWALNGPKPGRFLK